MIETIFPGTHRVRSSSNRTQLDQRSVVFVMKSLDLIGGEVLCTYSNYCRVLAGPFLSNLGSLLNKGVLYAVGS